MTGKPQIMAAAALCAFALSFCTNSVAQADATSAKHPVSQTSSTPPQSPTPQSPTPQSPVKSDATAPPPKGSAVVDFQNGLLHIVATDADLNSVLQQVSRLTGMRLQGATNGDRLYGDYGPAASVEVLSRMLDGLPYNFVMTQAPNTSAPQQLVISFRNGAPTPTGSPNRTNAPAATAGQQPGSEPSDSTNPEEGQPDQEMMQGTEPPPEEPPPDTTVPPDTDVNAPPTSTDSNDPDRQTGNPGAKTPEQFLEELRQMHQNGRPPQ